MTNDAVAAALDEIGTLLALKGENDFKCKAYHTAARTIAEYPGDVARLVAERKLATLRGVGEALRDKITTLVTTGRLPYLDDLRASLPAGLFDLLRLPGLGSKKVRALYTGLGIDSLDALKAACERGEVAGLKGFGAKTQEKILAGIAFLATVGTRVRIDQADPVAAVLLGRVCGIPGVARAEVCGSLRRRKETVGNIDLVAAADDPAAVLAAFAGLPEAVETLARQPGVVTVAAALAFDDRTVTMNATLRVVPDAQFPAAVLFATGSRGHTDRLSRLAEDRGLALSADGLTGPGRRSEADVYAALGLSTIPAELREDTGEIAAAQANALPELVTAADIRGVFHNHTTASDGNATLADMARAAKELGYEYLGIADHSQSLTVANGLTPDRVRKQWHEIDALNARLSGIRVLKGTEADILADGSIDFPDALLAGFDYVVASVHTLFAMPEEEMTARVCRALSHPAVTMLGHATGRLLLRRAAFKIDLDRVLAAAAEHGKMIEINAQPTRLDLDWAYVKKAKALGIPIVINPDAHSTGELALVPYGVDVARRGWLTKADVFNTRPLPDVLAELDRRKGGK